MLFIGSLLVIVLLAILVWASTSTLFGALGSFAIRKANWYKQKATEEYSNEK